MVIRRSLHCFSTNIDFTYRAVTDPDFRKVLVATLAFKNSESSSKGTNAMESLADTIASFTL